jgi:hypothetical protein
MGEIGAPEGTILELFFGTLCQAYRSSIHCQELRQQASWVLYDPVRGATSRSESEDLAAQTPSENAPPISWEKYGPRARRLSKMLVQDAQREVRTVFVGGFWGQLVSSIIWLASAGIATWVSPKAGIWTVVAGGFFIYPLTHLLLRLSGRRASVARDNPLGSWGCKLRLPAGSRCCFWCRLRNSD